MRGIIRKSIRTRSGVSEIRVERRAIGKASAPEPQSVQKMHILPAVISLADDISCQLRNRIAFPTEFWKGAVE